MTLKNHQMTRVLLSQLAKNSIEKNNDLCQLDRGETDTVLAIYVSFKLLFGQLWSNYTNKRPFLGLFFIFIT